jgi:hypothetical protein
MGQKLFIPLDYNIVLEAHHNILHQLSIMKPLIEQHMNELREQNNRHIEDWVMKEHKRTFTTWL